jgi:hypothetical protein
MQRWQSEVEKGRKLKVSQRVWTCSYVEWIDLQIKGIAWGLHNKSLRINSNALCMKSC